MLAVIAFVLVAVVVASLAGAGTAAAFNIAIPLNPLTFPQRLIAAAIAAFASGVLLKGLYHLQRLFGSYARGEIFTIENAGQIRQLGITALLWAVANILWIVTAALLLGEHSPHSFPFRADSIVTGLIVIALSWFMKMAAELREENDLTI